MQALQLQIEALIFASEQSINIKEIESCLSSLYSEELSEKIILKHLDRIKAKYAAPEHIVELISIDGGFQFLTKKEFAPIVQQLAQYQSKKKLSLALMETLAIIAYKQPVTRVEIEQIRGVNSDYCVQKLLEKELVVISGKLDVPGKPVLYATSKAFMDYFGLNSIQDLPQLKDIQSNISNEIGEAEL